MFKLLSLRLALSLFVGFLFADNFRFERYTIDDGLSQSAVTDLIQDQLGFVWMSTQDGLNRFDGHQFRIFRPDDKDPYSIPETYIYCMTLGQDNHLWLGTYSNGLVRFDPRTERFTRYANDPLQPKSLIHNRVRKLLATRDGKIWVGTVNGLCRFDPKTETFENIPSGSGPRSIGGLHILALAEDHGGDLWIGTEDGGLYRRNQTTGLVTPYRHEPLARESLSANAVRTLLAHDDGKIWVGTDGGLDLLDPRTGHIQHWSEHPDPKMRIPVQNITSLLRVSNGDIWAGSFDHGIYRIDLKKGQMNLVHQPNNPSSLCHNSIFSLLETHDGVVWVGTYGGGVSKFNPRTLRFAHINDRSIHGTGLSSNMLRAIMEDSSGRVWVGTMNTGLDLLDSNFNRIANFRARPNDPQSIPHDNVYALHEDFDGRIWIACLTGLARMDPLTFKIEQFLPNPRDSTSLSSPSVRVFYRDSDNVLWLGSDGGLNRFIRETNRFQRYLHDPGDPRSISNDRIRPMLKDHSGRMWIGTGEGLNLFDPRTGQCRRFFHDRNNPHSLPNDRIMALAETPDHKLLVGTLGGGLAIFDPSNASCQRFGVKEGLPNEVIYAILPESDGRFWLTTNNGLSRFDWKLGQFKNFFASDGLQSNEFNLGAATIGKSGHYYVGGINGLSIFRPEEILDNPNHAAVLLTNFFLFNQPQSVSRPHQPSRLSAGLSYIERIDLTHNDKVFAFEFTALDYTNPGKTKFAYQLEGFNQEWLETDAKKRFAVYTSLPAGRYFFKLKGANNDGVWSSRELRLEVCIHPPFWWSIPAQILYGLLALCLIWGFVRWRTGKIREKARIQLLIESEKMAVEANSAKSIFLSSMSHELRTPLSAIIGYTEMMLDEIHEICYEDLSHNLHHINSAARHQLTLVNNILDHSKIVAGRMEIFPEKVSVSELLDEVRGTVAPLITRNGNHFEVDCEQGCETLTVDPIKLKQCLINLLGNAGKFTKNGLVRLRAYHEGTCCCFEVMDTGVGIAEEDQEKLFQEFFQASLTAKRKGEGTGLGLAISRAFVQLMGGSIQLWSRPGQGSVFVIRLPRESGEPLNP